MAASDSEGGVQGTTPRPVRRKVENEEIKVGWVNVDDDDAPGWGCLTDQNIKEFLDICLLILIVDDFFQTWPLPSTKCGTRHSSWQLPRWDSWLGPVGSPLPSQHQLWTRWYVYRAKVLRVVEGGEQLDSMGDQAGEGAITDRVLLLLQGTKSGEREGQSNIGWDGGLHLAHEAVQSHADVRTRAPQSTPCHVQSHPSPVWTRAVSLLARQGWEGHPHQVQPPPRIRCLPSQLPVVQECLKAGR